jgi:hypothetical protein
MADGATGAKAGKAKGDGKTDAEAAAGHDHHPAPRTARRETHCGLCPDLSAKLSMGRVSVMGHRGAFLAGALWERQA